MSLNDPYSKDIIIDYDELFERVLQREDFIDSLNSLCHEIYSSEYGPPDLGSPEYVTMVDAFSRYAWRYFQHEEQEMIKEQGI